MARRRYQRPEVQSFGQGQKARWVLRYREDAIDGSGHRVRICKKTTIGWVKDLTKSMAQRAADDLLSKGANSSLRPTTTITFGEFVKNKFLPNAVPMRKPSGQELVNSHLKLHLLPWLGSLPLTAVNQETIQMMATSLIERKMASVTVRGVCASLQSVFKWARLWGYPTGEFRRGDLALPKVGKSTKVQFFTEEEAVSIFAEAGPFYGVLWQTQTALALRPGEVIGLMVEDVDFERGAVRIRRNAWKNTLGTTKGDNDVSLRLAPAMGAVLQKYLRDAWQENAKGLLFPRPASQRWEKSVDPMQGVGLLLQQAQLREGVLYPILDRLGIERAGRSLHAFRHTAASMLADGGANEKLTGSLLRHQDGGKLAWLYSHVLGGAEAAAMDGLGTRLVPKRPVAPVPMDRVQLGVVS